MSIVGTACTRKVLVRDFEEGKMVERPELQTKRIKLREGENEAGSKTWKQKKRFL